MTEASNFIPGKIPVDPNWCPKVGEVFKEGWYTIQCVSTEPVPVQHARDRLKARFYIQTDDEQATFDIEASPVGNGRAFRSALIQAIAGLAVKI